MEVGDSILKGSGDYIIQDNIVRSLAAFYEVSLGNPSKDRQRFVDSIVLISTPDWLKELSSFENVVETPFEYSLRTSNNARLCQTEVWGGES